MSCWAWLGPFAVRFGFKREKGKTEKHIFCVTIKFDFNFMSNETWRVLKLCHFLVPVSNTQLVMVSGTENLILCVEQTRKEVIFI